MEKKLTDEDLFKADPFKNPVSSIHLRACVGSNSGVSQNSRDCILIDGYTKTVDLLFADIKKKDLWIDEGVYPFVYCCRHSIELALKTVLKNLIIIYKCKNKILTRNDYICHVEEVCKKHDIQSLYNEIISFNDFQKEIKNELCHFIYFEDCIKDYYFDIDGDNFRYTFKRNLYDTNLQDITIIDIGLLYWKYKKLMVFLDQLINVFSSQLYTDYSKTHTSNLSRSQIEKLSLDLKGFLTLSEDDMKQLKLNLCKKYSISQSEFDKAVHLIKNHYSFSVNLGIENKFKDLSPTYFIKLGEIQKVQIKKDAAEKLLPGQMSIDITKLDDFSPFSKEYFYCRIQVANTLSENEKRATLTFYEVTSHPINGDYQCEDIDFIYNSWDTSSLNDDYIAEKIDCLLRNNRMEKALLKCGQITYLKWFYQYVHNSPSNTNDSIV